MTLCIQDVLAYQEDSQWIQPKKKTKAKTIAPSWVHLSGPKFFPRELEEVSTTAESHSTSLYHPQRSTKKKIKKYRESQSSPQDLDLQRKEEEMDQQFLSSPSLEEAESLIVQWTDLVEAPSPKELRHKLMEEMLEVLTSSEAILEPSIILKFWQLRGPIAPANNTKPLQVVSANVTKWSKQHFDWVGKYPEAVIAIQETHLTPVQVIEARNSAARMGFHWFGGCGSKPSPGVKGGVGVLCPGNLHARLVETLNCEGCGFVIIELPGICNGMCIASLYLQNSLGINVEPNKTIVATLMASLKPIKNWVVIGDWNVQIQDILSSNLAENMGGQFLATKEPTTDFGHHLDYCLTSRSLAGLTRLDLDESIPIRPHLAVVATLRIEQATIPIPQLAGFKKDLEASNEDTTPCIGDWEFRMTPASESFAQLSQQVELRQQGSVQGRGWYNPITQAPVVRAYFPRQWNGEASAVWHRVCKQLEKKQHCGQKLCEMAEKFWNNGEISFEEWKMDAGTNRSKENASTNSDSKTPLEAAREQYQYRFQQCKEDSAEGYSQWLDQAMVSGMRPLFKTVKAHEATTVRPFEDEHITTRSFCRILQWGPIWQITAQPADPPEFLKEFAIEQASTLSPLGAAQVAKYFKSMPQRAHGADGWSISMLKQLDIEECRLMVQLFHSVEQSGDVPNQWKVAIIVMLPKTWEVERPIALLHTVYKSLLKLRWNLIEQWLPVVREKMPWDAAMPGNATADVAIKRLMRCEVSKVKGKHHVTLYMDLSAFYEHIDHHTLIQQALDLKFPPMILYLAMSVYQGPRLVMVDGVASPTFAAKRGVLAGDPVAPLLAKIALFKPLQEIMQSTAVKSSDVWVDDISLDVEEASECKAAHNAFQLYQRLKQTLIQAGHKPSDPKTFFLASTSKAARALNKLRQEGDPEVKESGLDLGMTTSAGRVRTVSGQHKRLAKAGKRLKKLRSLKLSVTRKKVRVYSASIVAAGIWGHQSQGISPKVQKTLRMQAAKMVHLQTLGSVDIVLDLQESNIKDPSVEIIVQHWKTVSKVLAKGNDAQWIHRTWQVLWSRLRDRERWKRVTGPIGALVAYLHDHNVDASDMYEWKHKKEVVQPFRQASSLHAVAAFLRRVTVEARRKRISLQDNAQQLQQGIDWTVPRKILSKCLSKSQQASHYRTAWQGAFLTTHKSREMCQKCGAVAHIRHILYECPWWQGQTSTIPSHWDDIKDIPEITWTRGLVPAQLTALPAFSSGDESLRVEGRWLQPFPKGESELVYGTDASGGKFSSDPRLRVVSWSAVVGRVHEGKLIVLGKASGRLPPGSSIAQGEARALVFVLGKVEASSRVISDSKAAISQAEAKVFRPSMHPIWDHQFHRRGLLVMEWIKSHQTCEDYLAAHGPSHQWKWEINNEADILCGQRSAEVDVESHAKKVQRIDKIAFEVNHFLHDRVRQLFTAESTPAKVLLKAAKARKEQGNYRGPQNRPAADGGLNKKERRQLMIDSGKGGHEFEWTRKTSVNWSIACKKCQLYQEQVHSLEKFGRIEQQTCAHQPMPWPDRWKLGQGHDMHNLGAVWICKRCWGIVRPPAEELNPRLVNPCTGQSNKGSKKFGLLLPEECPVAFSVPQQLKPKQSKISSQQQTQQSKLRLFFSTSSRPSEEVTNPSRGHVQASPSSAAERSAPSNQAYTAAVVDQHQEEVPSPPKHKKDGKASQCPKQGEQKQRRQRQTSIPAPAEHLVGGGVQGTGVVAIRSGPAQNIQVNAGQEPEATRSPQAKRVVGAATARKTRKDGSKSGTRTSDTASGSKNIQEMFRRGGPGGQTS